MGFENGCLNSFIPHANKKSKDFTLAFFAFPRLSPKSREAFASRQSKLSLMRFYRYFVRVCPSPCPVRRPVPENTANCARSRKT